MNKLSGMVVVNESVLPEVIVKVLRAKEIKAASGQLSVSQACRIADVSRSAYYKYKDCVFRYEEQTAENVLSLSLLLKDRQGVLSAVISRLYELGLNIIKINQTPPADGVAAVSISVRKDSGNVEREELLMQLGELDGVSGVRISSGIS